MKNIGQIASEFIELSRKDAKLIAENKSKIVKDACLRDAEGDPEMADLEYGTLLYSVIAADDKITGKEFKLLCAHAEDVLGNWVDAKKKKALAEDVLADRTFFAANAKRFATNYLTKWSDEEKEAFVFCCLAACSLDRNITDDELAWLDELMNIANADE